MADYAGAVEAIKSRFTTLWVSGFEPRTKVVMVNENPQEPFPPRDGNNALQPWVLLSIEGAGAGQIAFGTTSSHGYLYVGTIYAHVYVPVGGGTADAFELAVAAGEIFRAKQFYDTPPCFVRTHAPRVDGGAPGSDDGIWFRVTASIPFEFYYRG